MESSEPFYKRYYRHQSLRGKIKLKWNWLRTDISVLFRHLGYKLKYGLFFDYNPTSEKDTE